MENPVDKYPSPPFKRQTQPWPGLASNMDPKPDHGETSYKGSGRLVGRKALITGGDSGMGRAAAIAYAREGADVAINYFPSEESDAQDVIKLIKAEGRVGLALPGDLREEAFCKKLVADAVQGLGGLDILISNAGRQQSRASIMDVSSEDFDATMKTNIYAPFWIIKAALPHMKPGAVIGGGKYSFQFHKHAPGEKKPSGGPYRNLELGRFVQARACGGMQRTERCAITRVKRSRVALKGYL
jgi:NAD(P)-dependent dehydrogenase (short-subunit alcohol dehydrogenase family)